MTTSLLGGSCYFGRLSSTVFQLANSGEICTQRDSLWSQFKEEGRRHAETRAVQLGNLLAAINLMETRSCFRPVVFQWVSGNDLGNLLATIGQELNWQRSEEAGYAFKAVYQFRSLQTCKPVHGLLSKGLGASFYTYNGKTAVHTGMSTAVLNLIPWNADARAAWCR